MSNNYAHAFGVEFYTNTKSALLEYIKDGIRQPYSFVVTPNVDHLAQLKENPELRLAYTKARFRVCDSRILFPLLHTLDVPVKEVIPGSDLTLDLLKWASQERLSLVLIGGTEEECSRLRQNYSGITIYHHNPSMGFIDRPEEVQQCLQFIRQHPSELVFYAVGAPRQEILASSIQSHERRGMGFCVGASISFATGTIKRAPLWVQRMRLEWFHRMLSDPRRLVRRYIHDFLFLVPAYFFEKIEHIKGRRVN